jgi:hypothetical protein
MVPWLQKLSAVVRGRSAKNSIMLADLEAADNPMIGKNNIHHRRHRWEQVLG